MLRVTNLSLPLHHPDEALPAAIVKRLRITPRDLVRHQVVRRGNDARDIGTTPLGGAHFSIPSRRRAASLRRCSGLGGNGAVRAR